MQIDGKTTIDQRIAGAFKAASEATGTSFDYLVATSKRESDHRPELASGTSSAKGLFQFVDQTWFDLVKREGPSLGLDGLAARITSDGKGGWTVADPTERARILALRTDPLVASVMAGRFTETNRTQLGASLGRAPTDGELYAAHVLGAAGATRLIGLATTEPGTTASVVFPKAAAANPGLFYGKDGGSRTVAELLSRLTGSAATAAEAGGRIAEAHAALAATAKTRTDPGTLALLLRAQAAAVVAKEPPPTTATPQGLADGADARYARTALAATGLPGAQTGATPPRGPALTGWRAAAPADAFSALMRSDAASESDAAAANALAPNGLPAVAAPTAAVVGAIGHTAGGGSGGIPYVDPYAPMALAAPGPDAPPVVLPAGARPSRIADRAATGAPAMPLPLVDPAAAAPRQSRILFSSPPAGALAVEAEEGGAVSSAVRVRTVAITPPTAPTAAAARPTSTTEATAEPDAANRATSPIRRARRPLDLTAAARGSDRAR